MKVTVINIYVFFYITKENYTKRDDQLNLIMLHEIQNGRNHFGTRIINYHILCSNI